MKVALLTSTDERCGIARYSRQLHAALAPLVDTDLVPIDPWPPEGERLDRLRAADIVHLQHEYSFWGTAFPPPAAYYEGLRQFRRPATLVMTAHTVAEAEAVIAARGVGLKPLVKRLALRLRPGLRREIESLPFLGADRIIVHSAGAAAVLRKRLQRPERVQQWPMPVQEWTIRASEWPPLSRRLGLEGHLLVTVFGFVTPEKGYEVAIDAMNEWGRQHPNVTLVIAGGARTRQGERYFRQLRQIGQASPVASRIRFTDYLDDADARALLEHSEVALLPYRSATGSYAAGAAVAAGCPLLTSDLPAFAEPLPALRFRAGDARDLAQKLNHLLRDDALRGRLAQHSRRYAAENSWARAAQWHVDLYRACEAPVRRAA